MPTPIGPSVSTSWSSQAVIPPWSVAVAARRSMGPRYRRAPAAAALAGRTPALGSAVMRQRFTARAVVVGDRAGTVVPDAVLDVADGRIALGWLRRGGAAGRNAAGGALPGVLMPGLVNAHSHAPMAPFRGQGEGLPLDRWLREVMWPREARLTADDVEVATTAASAELLGNGRPPASRCTSTPSGSRPPSAPPAPAADHRHAADPAARACRRSTSSWRPPSRWPPPRRRTGPSSTALGPHAAYTVPLPVLREAADRRARARPAAAPARRRDRDRGRRAARRRTASRCRRCWPRTTSSAAGCWPRTACTWTTADLELWQEYDVAVAHCPASNAKLASGIAPLRAMLDRGHPGRAWAPTGRRPTTPSTCSPTCGWPPRSPGWPGASATALTAAEAFWLATGAAADAIGRPDLGQLTAGRRADLVHVDTRDLVFEPVGDPDDVLAHLVWSGGGPARARRLGGRPSRWSPTGWPPGRRREPCGSRWPTARLAWRPGDRRPPALRAGGGARARAGRVHDACGRSSRPAGCGVALRLRGAPHPAGAGRAADRHPARPELSSTTWLTTTATPA